MKSHTQVVVIGGGVVGCSILYHLTKLGWSEVVLLERKELTAGSTWHAAGGFHTLNGDPNVARLQRYTIELYKEIELITGGPVGMHLTGGINVAATDSWWELLRNEAARHKVMGIDSELITPSEIADLCPIVDVSDIKGGMFMPDEGHIDPYSITHGYAKAAKQHGAKVYRHTKVDGLNQRTDGTWEVITNKGTIISEHVVNAAGLWAREVGEMVGIEHPILPFEHHYLVTEGLPILIDREKEIPTVADLDGGMYLRQEHDGVLLGVYESPATPWAVDRTSWDYGETDLLPNDLDRLYAALEKGFERFPEVANAGIKRVVNGPFTFSPDGNPLVGPVIGVPNYWVACGVMAGFAQGGGIGLTLAQWIIDGQPDGDVFGMDVARFGEYASKEYTIARASEFYERRMCLRYPNEFWPAGRPTRTTPLYETFKQSNVVFGVSDGLEMPLYFAPVNEEQVETPSFYRSNAFLPVASECFAVRNEAGVIDISAYGKYMIAGPDAEKWLDKIVASRLPATGRVRLAPLLDPNGRLMGDLTVMRLADDRFMLFGSGYLQRFHTRWFHNHLANERVTIENQTDILCGLAITGPNARKILQGITKSSLANEDFSFLSVGQMEIGSHDAIVGRVSLTGELGYEIYVPANDLESLFRQLKSSANGNEHTLYNYGIYALLSMRLEKSYGIWSREFSPDYTPRMCGLDAFIDYEKEDFIGREAVLRHQETELPQQLMTLMIDAGQADAAGFEPIWCGEELAGFLTSGGYGHTVKKSLAMGYLQSEFLDDKREFEVSILGERRPAMILSEPAYDSTGKKMRC